MILQEQKWKFKLFIMLYLHFFKQSASFNQEYLGSQVIAIFILGVWSSKEVK